MGRRKASVLPEPVGAQANTSLLDIKAGMACRCMGVGWAKPSLIKRLTRPCLKLLWEIQA